jgi:hypothetical protein
MLYSINATSLVAYQIEPLGKIKILILIILATHEIGDLLERWMMASRSIAGY